MSSISDRAAEAFLCGRHFNEGGVTIQPHYHGQFLLVIDGHEHGLIDSYGYFHTVVGSNRNMPRVRKVLNAVWSAANGTQPYVVKSGYLFFNGQNVAEAEEHHFSPGSEAFPPPPSTAKSTRSPSIDPEKLIAAIRADIKDAGGIIKEAIEQAVADYNPNADTWAIADEIEALVNKAAERIIGLLSGPRRLMFLKAVSRGASLDYAARQFCGDRYTGYTDAWDECDILLNVGDGPEDGQVTHDILALALDAVFGPILASVTEPEDVAA
jgi:hypothetical protein